MRNQVHTKSQWAAITAQPNGGSNENGGENQSDPETRATQVSSRSQLWDCVRVKGERFRRESQYAVLQHGGEIPSVKCDLLKEANREQRQHGPEKCRAARPT